MKASTLLAVVAGGFLAVASLTYWMTVGQSGVQDTKILPAFSADPQKDNTLSIQGWDQQEIDRILADFSKQYELPVTTLRAEQKFDKKFVIVLPKDFEPRLLFFLVNYIQYPRGFDLKQHSIGVVAFVVLSSTFGVPDADLSGKRAIIYVPADDTDYDRVYAQAETGKTYQIPFTDLIWKRVTDARIPAAISGL